MSEAEPQADRSIALLMWGDLFEDFFDTIDVSVDRFRAELTGGWLFGYVDALAQAGVHTTLIHVSGRVGAPQRFTHEPTGADVVLLPAPRRHRWLRRLYRRFRARRSLSSIASYGSVPVVPLVRELRRCGAEAILTQEYEHARFDVFVLVGRLLRLPVFATFQGGDQPRSRLERLVRPFAVRASNGLIIGSVQERQRVHTAYRLPAARIAAVPNAMDVSDLAPLPAGSTRQRLGIGDRTVVVEWHGRVTIARKGLDLLLAAWVQLCRERPDADVLLLLVGTGPDAEEFGRRIAATGLASIRWRDEYVVDRGELLRYQSVADVFVLPSRHEGFPVAPIEAMALGVPVVAADAPGVTDILPDGEASGGIVVPREDPAALATALCRLVDDPALRREMGQRARRRVEHAYSLDAVGQQLRTVLLGEQSRTTAPARVARGGDGPGTFDA
jgi:glycosyltransferase involved in cell wall biosynthesis